MTYLATNGTFTKSGGAIRADGWTKLTFQSPAASLFLYSLQCFSPHDAAEGLWSGKLPLPELLWKPPQTTQKSRLRQPRPWRRKAALSRETKKIGRASLANLQDGDASTCGVFVKVMVAV